MRFLLCPLAGHGYVYPMIGIAQALRKRGHAVAFVTGPDFSDTLTREKLQRIPCSRSDGVSFEVPLWYDSVSVAMQVMHVEYALSCFPADAIVTSHLAYGPLIVGERNHIPTGVLGFATYLWPTEVGSSHSSSSEDEKRRVWRLDGMIDYYNRARQILGVPSLETDVAEALMLGDVFLVQSVPELEGDVRRLPPQVHLIGSCLWEPEEDDPQLFDWLAEAQATNEPIIYVQHGRLFHRQSFWPFLVDALEGKPVRVVASVGRMDEEPPETPANFLVRDHVSQGPVLARAIAAVSTGNTTAVLGALLNGVPMLLTPGGGEQPDLAYRCAEAGAAICIDPSDLQVGRADFAQALEHVIFDTALRNGAQRVAQALRRVNGPERAADILERMAYRS